MGNCFAGDGKESVGGGAADPGGGRRKEIGTVVDVGGHSVKIVGVLGQGGFAVVFRAVATADGESYALKKILAPSSDQDNVLQCRKEIKMMEQMKQCKKVVQLVASSENVEGGFVQFWLLLELCNYGHVVDLMNTKLDTKFTETEVLTIFGDVVEAVAAMHSQTPPIAHRDIKPENVLKSSDAGGCFKLCDFGSGTTKHATPGEERSVNNMSEDVDANTTIQYRAPEQADLYSRKRVDHRVDNWALGVFLYKLLFFDDAFGESSLAIVSGKYTIPEGHRYSPAVIELLASMLIVDPDARAVASAILETTKKLLHGGSSGGVSSSSSSSSSSGSGGGGGGGGVGDGGKVATGTQLLSSSHSYNTFGDTPAANSNAPAPAGGVVIDAND